MIEKVEWLRGLDSNQNNQLQRLAIYLSRSFNLRVLLPAEFFVAVVSQYFICPMLLVARADFGKLAPNTRQAHPACDPEARALDRGYPPDGL
jgi:hypothetical protein